MNVETIVCGGRQRMGTPEAPIVPPIHALPPVPAAGNPQRFSGRRRPGREPAKDADRPALEWHRRLRSEVGKRGKAEGNQHSGRGRSRPCRIAGLRDDRSIYSPAG
jgi:hypothetical protein